MHRLNKHRRLKFIENTINHTETLHIIDKSDVQDKPFEALKPEGEGKQKKMGRTESLFKICSIYWNHPFSAYAKF